MKMTVHRALAQLKSTEDRILDKIQDSVFVSSTTGKTGMCKGITVERMKTQIESDYKSINDMIRNYENVRLAIVRSNSGIGNETKNIVYADEACQMTLAEILAYQKHILPMKQNLLSHLKAQYTQVSNEIERTNERVSIEASKVLDNIAGKNSDQKIDKNQTEVIMQAYLENNQKTFVDPLNVKEVISQATKECEDKFVWADSILSEANALRTIEVNM